MKNACQSCGMPLSKDPQGGGTNADGKKSTLYCSHCYRNGSFTNPDLSLEQMKEKVKDKLKEMKIPGFVAWFFTRSIGKLERWKKNNKCGCSKK